MVANSTTRLGWSKRLVNGLINEGAKRQSFVKFRKRMLSLHFSKSFNSRQVDLLCAMRRGQHGLCCLFSELDSGMKIGRWADGLCHWFDFRGLLSMANSGRVLASISAFLNHGPESALQAVPFLRGNLRFVEDTNGSQFFILFKPAHHLNGVLPQSLRECYASQRRFCIQCIQWWSLGWYGW